MEPEKKPKSPLCFFFNLLGNKGKESFIRYQAKINLGSKEISFNGDIEKVNNILFIIPDDILEAFYQVENMLSIMSKYNNSSISILTGENSAPWFKQFHGVSQLFKYNTQETCVFSYDAKILKSQLKEHHFDICFILDRSYSLILNYFLTQIDADYRISYFHDSDFPYSNLRIKALDDAHAVENNLSISRALKIPLHDKLHWSVSKDSIAEIGHALKEQGIDPSNKAGCIDVDFYVSNYGKKWTKDLVDKVKAEVNEISWYIYVKNADDSKYADWLRSLSLPCFLELSPTRTAAILYKSEILLSGKSFLFELSYLLKRKAVGIFKEDELKRNCRNNKKSKGIAISDSPDDETINEIINTLKEL